MGEIPARAAARALLVASLASACVGTDGLTSAPHADADAAADGSLADGGAPSGSGCGNRTVEGTEQCDDGNRNDNDGCRNDCTWARCGDGVVRTGVEACDDGPIAACPESCEACAGTLHDGACYENVGSGSWVSMRELCSSRGGHLTTLSSSKELGALTGLIGSGGAWLGATDGEKEGTYTWVTGEPMAYLPWATGQPNGATAQNCAAAFGSEVEDKECGGFVATGLCETPGWIVSPAANHAYRAVFTPLSRASAETECTKRGGHLAVDAPAMRDVVLKKQYGLEFWIASGDASCAVMHGTSGVVATRDCAAIFPTFCEID